MAGSWTITEQNGVQTITPDIAYEPGRPDRLYERLTHWGLPTAAQAIITACFAACHARGQAGPDVSFGFPPGVTVTLPGMFHESSGTAATYPDACAEALIAVVRDPLRTAAGLRGQVAALHAFDAAEDA